MNAERLIGILENAGLDVRPDYSGRGMYGASCVGFVVEESELLPTVAELVAYSVTDDNDDEQAQLVKLFHRVRTDSMGRDSVIVYFPSVQVNKVAA